jgi:formylglycine-generating enzyme required for sulfatase activity
MRHLLLAFVAYLCLSGSTLAERRLTALVVGVDRYDEVSLMDKHGIEYSPNLAKPSADARAVSEILEKSLGFSVRLMTDPDVDTRKSAIEAQWTEILDGAKDGDIVLFYFAGHGVELKGNNYLIPRDAVYRWDDPNNVERLTSSSIEFQSMIAGLAHKQNGLKDLIGIFIIDACRENPFDFRGSNVGKLVITLGPQVSPSRQVFIMYSAGSGQEALDGGEDAAHSVYAEVLLNLLKDKDVPLSEMAQELRLRVYDIASSRFDHLQTPAYYDQLRTSRTLSGEPGKPQRYGMSNNLIKPPLRSLGHRDGLIECPYCPELVVLRSGSFKMGSNKQEAGHQDNESPPHEVFIKKKFAIGKYEVTIREWDRCVNEHGCSGVARASPTRPTDSLKPVVDISWYDASDYARWLSGKTGAVYRLATEAEWEYAARAEKGADTRYFFGNDAGRLCQYANGADLSVGLLPYTNRVCDDGVGRETSIVGRYRPNAWGLHDMLGNAWEWVQDCWHESYDGAPPDGSSWNDVNCGRRVARGGSWRSGPEALRSAARNAFPPDHHRPTLGFRVVRELAE